MRGDSGDTPKIGEIDEHRRVSLSYCRPARETYVRASGITQVLRDEAKTRELWTPALRPWLGSGFDDPEAEYWDSHRRVVLPLYRAGGRLRLVRRSR